MQKSLVVNLSMMLSLIISNMYAQNNKQSDIPIIALKAVNVIEQTEDRLYLNRPTFLNYDSVNNLLYVVNSGDNNILVFNDKLEYVKTIGRFGQGPGEFESLVTVSIQNDKIITTDRNRIQILTSSGEYIGGFRVQIRAPTFPICSCMDSQERVFVPYSKNNNLISVYTKNGDLISSFGSLYGRDNSNAEPHEVAYDNLAHLRVDEEDNIYIAFFNQHFIRKYDKNFKLIWEVDLSDLDAIKKKIKDVKEQRDRVKNQTNTVIFNAYIKTVCLDQKYLYLHISAGKFPVVAIDRHTGNVVAQYRLSQFSGEQYFINHMAADGSRIFTVGSGSQIIVTNLQ